MPTHTGIWKSVGLMALGMIVATPQSASADICWTWQFGKGPNIVEAGTLVSDGSLVLGVAPVGTYSVLDIAVTDSTEAAAIGTSLGEGTLNEGGQPGLGFYWDGSVDTQWTRDNGNITNGANFYVTGTDLRYFFFPGSYSLNENQTTLVTGPFLNLTPGECVSDPDLVATLVDSADPVSSGSSYSYTLTVDNVGVGDASDVLASTTLSGAAHTVISANASQGSCMITGSDVDCDLGTLVASGQATVTITVAADALGTITADSSVDAAEDDATPTDNSDSESTDVVNAPPDCSAAEASADLLIADPLALAFANIDVTGVTDPNDNPITITIDSITQDEPNCGLLDPCPDGGGIGTETASVRRQAGLLGLLGNGRVYHIGFTAEDGNGASCQGDVTVGVKPLVSSPTPVDDAPPSYDSTL